MSDEVMAVHGVVARIIDVPSQGNTYLRIELPIEYHAELTRLFYGKAVIVVPAGSAMKGMPYGMRRLDAEPLGPPPPAPPPRAMLRPAPKAEMPTGGSLCKSAAMICNERSFQQFMWSRDFPDQDCPGDYGSEDAANQLRHVCVIKSRSELDHSEKAAAAFRYLMAEYREYREAHPELAA